jgi:hypothetical protein
MKRILISLSDSEKEQKEERLLKWLEEENIQTEALEEYAKKYVQTEIDQQLKKNEEKLRNQAAQTDEKVKKTSKKMRLVAVVSLGVILILGGLAFFQMLETDRQKELLKESQNESRLHRQVVQLLQDSLIAREMRHKAVISADTVTTSK